MAKPIDAQKETQEIAQSLKQIRRSSIILTVLIVAIAIMFFGLSYQYWANKDAASTAPTLDDVYDKTLAGEETSNNFLYNGYVFIYDGFFWIVRIAKGVPDTPSYIEYNIPFYYNPQQMTNLSYQNGTRDVLLGKQLVYLTQDAGSPTELSIAAIEVGRIVGNRYGLLSYRTQAAFTTDTGEGVPQATCENTSMSVGVIYFKLGNTTEVFAQGDCIIVQGQTPREVIRAADRLAFAMLNIVPEGDISSSSVGPLATDTVDEIMVSVETLLLTRTISMNLGGGVISSDQAEGIFYVPVVNITNNGNESLVFTPGAFKVLLGNQTERVDYARQRFLDNKLVLENTILPGQTKTYRIAYDLPDLYNNITFVVQFFAKEPLVFDLPVRLP